MEVLRLNPLTTRPWRISLAFIRLKSFLEAKNYFPKCSPIFLIFTLFNLVSPNSAVSQATSPEYKIKAVYLYNFIQFVDWPTNAFADAKSPLIIGVLGKNPFGMSLKETVEGEVVKGREIKVRNFENISEIKECHMLFISSSETPRLKSILAALKGRSIFTVGETAGFAAEGGVLRFYNENNKIRFRINLSAAKDGNLSLSSKLLQLAELVPTKKE